MNTLLTRRQKLKKILVYFKRSKLLYFMILPGFILIFLFKYMPMFGLVLAFKEYNAMDGIIGSRWVGFQNFEFFITTRSAWNAVRNTFVLNLSFLILTNFAGLVIALLLNEIRKLSFKKITQSMVILPYFMSWMIVGVISYNLLSPQYGVINNLFESVGIARFNIYNDPGKFPILLAITDMWKGAGYASVIFIAVLTGISPEYYEAAKIDGASKMQMIKNISIPILIPTIIILILLRIGQILNMGFGMYFALVGNNSLVFPTSDVIDLWIYRSLREYGEIGMSAAAGLFKSIIGIILVFGSNALARKYNSDAALF